MKNNTEVIAFIFKAYFLQKVYADSQLGYSQSENFDIPAGFDPCGNVIEEGEGEEEVDEFDEFEFDFNEE